MEYAALVNVLKYYEQGRLLWKQSAIVDFTYMVRRARIGSILNQYSNFATAHNTFRRLLSVALKK